MALRQTCSRRYPLLLRLYLLLLALIALCAATVMAAERQPVGAFVMGGIFVLLCAGAALTPVFGGNVTYCRSGGSLRIERGGLVNRKLIVRRSDIRYAEISGNPLERRLGVCTVTFFTSGGRVRLKGVQEDEGRQLQYLFGGEAAE